MQNLNDLLKTIISGVSSKIKSLDSKIENIEVPATLPNPNSLILSTGPETVVYDGSSQKILNIPEVNISGKMDNVNPTGTGSFSLNRKSGTTVGDYSHAEGHDTTASGVSSHAEGDWTTASGDYSHAEGNNTTASGGSSHAEGSYTRASGDYSHAEGTNTSSIGNYSHAEGNSTTASGWWAHTEGHGTRASGDYSHAEGKYTVSASECQHAQGRYNVEDYSVVYADIIGNGTEDDDRSNAATVDWNGNAWYAGNVYVGSTSGINKDDGSKKLATEEYVDSPKTSIILNSSTTDSTKKFSITVDDSGTITATEVV